jgi:hypothetical protein
LAQVLRLCPIRDELPEFEANQTNGFEFGCVTFVEEALQCVQGVIGLEVLNRQFWRRLQQEAIVHYVEQRKSR